MLASLWRRLALLVTRDRATRELEEEMELHRQLRAESLARHGHGDPVTEASRRFGHSVRHAEAGRDAWGLGGVDALWQDIRYAARRLRHRPGFTASVVGILALGIGATTAMFSAVDAAMLRPLPFTRPGELVVLNRLNVPYQRERPSPVPPFDITTVVQTMPEVFSSVAAFASGGLNLADPDRARRVKVGVVSGSFFTTVGVQAAHGRVIGPADGHPDAPRVALLSWSLWQSAFGGSDVLGQWIPLNSTRYEIVGVMPRGFTFPGESDVWIPMNIPTTATTVEAFRGYMPSFVMARVAPGVTAQLAEARMFEAWRRYASTFPRTPGRAPAVDRTIEMLRAEGAVTPLRANLVSDRRTALLVLLAVTGLLLLIACANVTNLLLSYGISRARELAVRTVLGATRTRILRQLLSESVMLAVCGAAVGVAVAPLMLGVLRTVMPARLAGLAPVQVDLRVLAFAVVLALVTGVLFGLWPAFGATRGSSVAAIKAGGGHGATAGGARRSQRLLVGAEIALAGVLLVGAGLMLRSFARLVNVDTGMRAEQVATLELTFLTGTDPALRGVQRTSILQRLSNILEELRRQPGMIAAGAVNDLPLRGGGGISISVTVEGAPREANDAFPRYLVATAGYFEAMGIPLRSGRLFSALDDNARSAVISESMARLYWPDTDPLGRTFLFGGDGDPFTVVGVVADVRELGLESDPGPQMYLHASTNLSANAAIVVRGAATMPEGALLAALRQAVRRIDPAQPVYNVRMMDEVIGSSLATRKANTVLISLFGLLALTIAALGVYAVASNAVAQRTREFGIRAALGATRGHLLRHVTGEMVLVVAGGILAGAAIAWAASRVMQSMVYGVTVRDPGVFVVAPAVLMVAALLATLLPARRAMEVEPAEVMRND